MFFVIVELKKMIATKIPSECLWHEMAMGFGEMLASGLCNLVVHSVFSHSSLIVGPDSLKRCRLLMFY